MTIVQLQLDLWQQLEQAQAQPQATDWHQLCLAFDEAIERVAEAARAGVCGDHSASAGYWVGVGEALAGGAAGWAGAGAEWWVL